jgi:hypothetical protein
MFCNNYELDTIPARTVIMFFLKRTTMQALQQKERLSSAFFIN